MIMQVQCAHPFIIKVAHTFQTDKRLFFVLEYCCGGELLGLLKRKNRLSEEMYGRGKRRAKFYSAQILLAL